MIGLIAALLAVVTTPYAPVSYACDGSTAAFTVNFPYLSSGDLTVTSTTGAGFVTTLVNGLDFTTLSSTTSTATLTLFIPSISCPGGNTLKITRSTALTQPQIFRQQTSFNPQVVETAIDRLELQNQETVSAHAVDKGILATKDAAQDLATSNVTTAVAALNTGSHTVGDTTSILAFGSSTARTLTSRFSDVANIKDYGATGNGVTDDSAAILAAITAVSASAGTVYAPPGTYVAKNVAVASAVTIQGAGRDATTFKLPVLTALDGFPILNITASGVVVRGITFNGQKASQTADGFSDSFNGGANGQGRAYRAGIRVYNAVAEIVGLTVEDCKFINTFGAGIAAQNTSHAKIRRNVGNGNNFETVMLYSTTAAGGTPYYVGNEVTHNEIYNTGSGDASFNGNGIVLNHSSQAIVSYNEIDTVERSGIKCEGCTRTAANHNSINNTTLSTFPAISFQIDCVGCSAVGNTITNSNGGITFGHVAGGTGFFGVSAINNTIDTMIGSQADGVDISLGATSAGFTVSGNVMRNIGRYGIYMAAGAAYSDLSITVNNIQTIGGVNGVAGIRVTSTTAGTSGVLVSGNHVDLNSSTSSDAAINFIQSAAQTIARGVILGNSVINQSGRTTITDGNVALFTSGMFGGNASDGFIRMGSAALQGVAPSTGGFTAGFQFAGVQGTAVTFANLGTPANGNLIYCSDCTIANPCAGAGTGALAKRLNGVWVCN